MLAQFISFVLGPFVWLPVLLTFFILKTNLTRSQIYLLFPLLLIFQVGIPLLHILIAYRSKKISDLDLSRREERIMPMVVGFICLIISLIIVKFFGSPILYRLYLFLIFLLIINGAVTIFWKISFHMAINVVGSLLLNFLYHWQLPILYLTIPLVYWARLKLKRHTHPQLIVAGILNGIAVFLFLRSFNYL